MKLKMITLTAAIVAACAGGPTQAQCEHWSNGPLTGTQVGVGPLKVYSVAAWDPDGAGPKNPEVVAGGDFATAGTTTVNNIGRWDGTQWRAFGSGIGGYVYDIMPYDFCSASGGPDVVVAAGWFLLPNGLITGNIASWDEAAFSWKKLDTEDMNSEVHAMCKWDPDGPSGPLCTHLVAAGLFTTAGGHPVKRIAEYSGHWSQVGAGLDNDVWTVIAWDKEGSGTEPSHLVAGGLFVTTGGVTVNNIAEYDGTTWKAMGTGVTGGSLPIVDALGLWDPDGPGPAKPLVIAGGSFTTAGGVAANNIAAWNGTSWSSLGTGVGGRVYKAFSYDPDGTGPGLPQLIATGSFTTVGGAPANYVARWDGTSWHTLGTGVSFFGGQCATAWDADGAGPLQPELVIGGDFAFTGDNSKTLLHIARWNGAAWNPLSSFTFMPSAFAMANFGGRAVGAGSFQALASDGGTATNIASWNGTTVGRFGSGFDGSVFALKSFNVTVFSRTIIAGGQFTNAGGASANRIASWNENDLTGGLPVWKAMGSGFNSQVNSIERYNSQIYACGFFTTSGANSVSRIARWDGTNWQPLGTGLNGAGYSMKVYNGSLYVGGAFTTAGGISSGGLARWNGSTWSNVGGFFNGIVNALEVHNNELVIGGQYPGLPGSPNIAKYNGSVYTALGSGGANGAVTSLHSFNGDLYMGGNFTSAGSVSVSNLARWDGSAWNAVDGGANSYVYAMLGYQNELEVGGTFSHVLNATIPAPGWSRFSKTGVPWFNLGPSSVLNTCLGSAAAFHAQIAPGYTGATFQWRHNGVPLNNGTTFGGTTIGGATTLDLTVSNIRGGDAGSYDCVATTTCGNAACFPATLSVCVADFICDGFVSGEDLDAFTAAFESGDPSADTNGDGFVSGEDFDAYLIAFEAGC